MLLAGAQATMKLAQHTSELLYRSEDSYSPPARAHTSQQSSHEVGSKISTPTKSSAEPSSRSNLQDRDRGPDATPVPALDFTPVRRKPALDRRRHKVQKAVNHDSGSGQSPFPNTPSLGGGPDCMACFGNPAQSGALPAHRLRM